MMRQFAKVSPQFWFDETGRQLRQYGMETQLMALYLLTSPHSNMVGIYYLPIVYIAHETGISLDKANECLQTLCNIDFCSYDSEKEYVWVHDMARSQIDTALNPNDNRVKYINSIVQALPSLSFLAAFYQRYQINLCLNPYTASDKTSRQSLTSTPLESPSEGPSKPLRSQEKEKEKEKEQENEQEKEKRARDPFIRVAYDVPLCDDNESDVIPPILNHKAGHIIDTAKKPFETHNWKITTLEHGGNRADSHRHISDWFEPEQDNQLRHLYQHYPALNHQRVV
jgi:hypothetical protein